jgi:HTH-type transcriptional regulator / antitoxin HigA
MPALTRYNIFTPRYRKLMREFPLRELRTKADAQAATEILDRLFSDHFDDPGEEQYVFVLTKLLGDYEDEPFISSASGVEVVRHLMAEHGINQKALARAMNIKPSAASMMLSGVRPITLDQAKSLGRIFGLPAATFIDGLQ